jgi:hypothetical protein
MTTRDITRMPAALRPLERPREVDAAQAIQVTDELDQIVGRSGRKSRLRRVLGGIRGGIANWLERAVLAAPPPEGSDLPPQIRFPFF